MFQKELSYFLTLAIIVLGASYLPTSMLMVLDSIIIRITLIFAVLFLISLGPTAGIFGILAIGILYLERNRRKVAKALTKVDLLDNDLPVQMTVEEESIPQQTVKVNPFDEPRYDMETFMPKEECGSDDFHPVADTINEKVVLPTIYPRSNPSVNSSSAIYEKSGFGHIPGVQTIG